MFFWLAATSYFSRICRSTDHVHCVRLYPPKLPSKPGSCWLPTRFRVRVLLGCTTNSAAASDVRDTAEICDCTLEEALMISYLNPTLCAGEWTEGFRETSRLVSHSREQLFRDPGPRFSDSWILMFIIWRIHVDYSLKICWINGTGMMLRSAGKSDFSLWRINRMHKIARVARDGNGSNYLKSIRQCYSEHPDGLTTAVQQPGICCYTAHW
jgi:hypothetical protein